MIIRHKRFMDACFQYHVKVGNSYGGKWVNMGYVNSWYMPTPTQWIDIENITEWEKCLEPKAKCLRYAKWAPL